MFGASSCVTATPMGLPARFARAFVEEHPACGVARVRPTGHADHWVAYGCGESEDYFVHCFTAGLRRICTFASATELVQQAEIDLDCDAEALLHTELDPTTVRVDGCSERGVYRLRQDGWQLLGRATTLPVEILIPRASLSEVVKKRENDGPE